MAVCDNINTGKWMAKIMAYFKDYSHSNEDSENNIGQIRVSKEKQLIKEFLAYIKDVTNPAA